MHNYFSILGIGRTVGGSEIFHSAFFAFLAIIRIFLEFFWLLEVGLSGPFWPKYAPWSGWQWEKHEHVHDTFANLMFRNFA